MEAQQNTGKGNKSAQAPGYAFQFWVESKMIHDISGISLEDAKELWASCEKKFTTACGMGQEAEIVIWMPTEKVTHRCQSFKRVSSADVVIHAGIAFVKEPVFT